MDKPPNLPEIDDLKQLMKRNFGQKIVGVKYHIEDMILRGEFEVNRAISCGGHGFILCFFMDVLIIASGLGDFRDPIAFVIKVFVLGRTDCEK